jgi:hypothetical protein
LIFVADADGARRALRGGELRCPDCRDGVLGGWGTARTRRLRGAAGEPMKITPVRARCRAKTCRRTHVLLPARVVPRRACTAEAVGAALLSEAGAETPAGVPAATARRWRRAVRRGAAGLVGQACRVAEVFGASVFPTDGLRPKAGSDLIAALEALGAAARVFTAGIAGPAFPAVPAAPSGIDYLALLEAAHRRELAARLRLADPGAAGRLAPCPPSTSSPAGGCSPPAPADDPLASSRAPPCPRFGERCEVGHTPGPSCEPGRLLPVATS